MSNHLHLIVGTKGEFKIEDIIRDFKKYTSVHVCRSMEESSTESRKHWMLNIFRAAAEESGKHQKYKFWRNEYHPVELFSNAIIDQKLNYVHENPVKELLVDKAEEYLYSSARNYAGLRGLLEVEFAD